jgi:S1-C subfamily serine protease
VPFDDLIRQKLGLVLLNLPPQTAASSPVKPGQGLFIEEVEKLSPAEKAQLQRGFLLTAIDDRATGDLIGVADILSTKKSGDLARLAVVVPRRISNSYVEYRQASITLAVR